MPAIRRLVLCLALASSAALVAACSGVSEGIATPSPPSPKTSDSSLDPPRQQKLSISNPLNIDKLAKDPCSALSGDQVRAQKVSAPGEPLVKGGTSSCLWVNDNSVRSITVLVEPQGLTMARYYAENGGRTDSYFVKKTLDGYPGYFGALSDERSAGRCQLKLGVNDSRVIDVAIQDFTLGSAEKSCGYATKIASMVLANLKGQG